MKILVCSRISIPAKDRTLPAWEHLRSLGHEVWVEHPGSEAVPGRPDALISMGVTIMDETFAALERFPGVPLYAYNWDVYKWVWDNPRPGEYDYKRYGELLARAKEIWVPSACTGRRTEQWYGLQNWHVILSACPWWEYDDVRDEGYALCTLRHIPDPWDTKFEEACEELSIPYLRTDHNLPYEEYQKAVAHCRFLVSHYYEASTGGLTLLEGYYHGKPCLLSDSEWHGGRDYMGGRALYFRFGDEADFKRQLLAMHQYHHPSLTKPPVREECRRWITENFSDIRMVNQMLARIHAHA